MSLGPGARLGPYEVVAAIGAGGMGEVYRARDTRLGREVAIKVLPESFANDADRLARFEREAQVLASLNHPNIATIHGLEERALVMELVEGPTLADRIAEGPIPIDEALPIARQIAEALEAAHERGIIHRDLKPANIKLRPDGTAKVLDFGLAKLGESGLGARGSGFDGSLSPTISVQATMAGVILGTAAYMSPEQARGKAVDRRADIWGFGCVLYEMLAGKPPFDTGDTISDAVAAILKNEPDWNALPSETPLNIRTLLRRCLQKDVQKRLPHIGIARMEIEEAAAPAPPSIAPVVRAQRSFSVSWPLAFVAVVFMMLVYSALPWLQDDEPFGDLPEMRTEIVTPSDAEPMSFAFSPDGRQITFVASDNGVPRLWLRSLASSIAQPLAGTEGALSPFWSPDSRSIGFLADGKVKRLDLGSGVPQTLASIGGTSRGATWSRDGVVLFPTSTASGLVRVSALGGAVTPVTKLEGTVSHRYPYLLPDGRHFIFYALAPQPRQGIYLGSLDSSTVKLLTQAETAGIYTKNGWLLWVRGGALIARRLDVDRGELVGSQLTIADPIAFDAGATVAAVSASADGLIAYRAGAASRHQLVWFDRAGKMLGPFAKPDDTFLSAPRLSPDGKRVAVWRVVQGNADIWILDGARMTRFTFDGAQDRYAVWSSDGTGIFFDSTRDGGRDIYVKRANGADGEEVLLESSSQKAALSASGDGKFLLYGAIDEKTNWDLWVLPLTGERKPRLFLKTNFAERTGHFSPDGRWIAYASDESGRFEVYVRPFVDNGAANSGEWQVSTNGGVSPRWRDDGKELYYVAPDGTMMAAPITTGATFESGTPTALFRPRIWGAGTNPDLGRQFDVASDGRFLVNVVLDESAAPITILQNWKPPTN